MASGRTLGTPDGFGENLLLGGKLKIGKKFNNQTQQTPQQTTLEWVELNFYSL